MGDVLAASAAQSHATGAPMQLSDSTVASLDIMQDEEYGRGLVGPHSKFDGGEMLDQLTDYFVKYEVPVGMINKLMALQLYFLNFIIDDSGGGNRLINFKFKYFQGRWSQCPT